MTKQLTNIGLSQKASIINSPNKIRTKESNVPKNIESNIADIFFSL